MTSLRKLRIFGKELKDLPNLVSETLPLPRPQYHLVRALGWISAGAGVLGLGLVIGRELRRHYKFTRLTPYDFYSHAGDEIQDMEFGVGI
jgi:hypothetical protein